MRKSDTRVPNDARPLPTASFALRPDQVDQIRKIAAQRGTSQSAMVREAIDLLMRDVVRQALEQLQQTRTTDSLAPLDHPIDGESISQSA